MRYLVVGLGLLGLSIEFRRCDTFQIRQNHLPATGVVCTSIQPGDVPPTVYRQFVSGRLFALLSTQNDSPSIRAEQDPDDLVSSIVEACGRGDVDEAMHMLDRAEHLLRSGKADCQLNASVFVKVMQTIAAGDTTDTVQQVELVLSRMLTLSKLEPSCTPKGAAYNSVILAWSKSFQRESGQRCLELLEELWSRYNATGDSDYLPMKSTYISTLTAIARSGRNRDNAVRAEALLDEMERVRHEHQFLAPTTICVNIVLDTWSKCGDRHARKRCETILQRMEELHAQGRTELQPDTTSFNTVLNALAQSRVKGLERRAEELLEHMEALSNADVYRLCQPDRISFNTVLNAWSRSREPGAALRADAILQHMEKRYELGSSDIQPDTATYNTVMTAWSRSTAKNGLNRTKAVLQRMEKAYNAGNNQARPNALSYNILIHALSKSNDAHAAQEAVETLALMKRLSLIDGRSDCRPDVYTYTAVCNVLAKNGSIEGSLTAEKLLEELEEAHEATGDPALKPNTRLFTAVIHAIARCRADPGRAEKVVERMERLSALGETDLQPDTICYGALLNAFGWSTVKHRSLKCYQIYQRMMELFVSGKNYRAKPDIITCNAVLNACAYEDAESDEESAGIMTIVVDMLEAFESTAPKFGWPNHQSYALTLAAISRHMQPSSQRTELAQSTFWRCCKSGHVSTLVVNVLHNVVPWETFAELMGPSLFSAENEKLGFNLNKFPSEWTRFAPNPKQRKTSRPSRKRKTAEVTKLILKSSQPKDR